MLYEVLVIARSVVDEHELLQENLNTWLVENKGLNEQKSVIPNHSAIQGN